MTGTSLDEIFASSDEVDADPPKQEPEEASEDKVVDANPPTSETGDDPLPAEPAPEAAQVDEDNGVPPAPVEETPSSQVPRAALEDERRKRQEAQATSKELADRIAALEQQLTAPTPQPSPQPQPQTPQEPIQPPDPWTDPEGALAYERQVNNENFLTMKIDFGRDLMRSVNSDYDDVEALFIAEAQRDPTLTMQMMQAPNPAKYAYDKGRQLKLMNEIGSDPAAYEQQVRTKILEEMKEAQAASSAAQPPADPPPQAPATPSAPPPPTSLAGVPSSAPRQANKVQWEGPTPLDKILS